MDVEEAKPLTAATADNEPNSAPAAVAPRGRVYLRVAMVVAGVVAFVVGVGIVHGRIQSANVSAAVQFSTFGDINIAGSDHVQTGDNNVQVNGGSGNTVIGGSNNGGNIIGSYNGNTVTSQTETITGNNNRGGQQQAKECEGSGNGGKVGTVGVVCCKGPTGVCCGEAATAQEVAAGAKCTYGKKMIPGLTKFKFGSGP